MGCVLITLTLLAMLATIAGGVSRLTRDNFVAVAVFLTFLFVAFAWMRIVVSDDSIGYRPSFWLTGE